MMKIFAPNKILDGLIAHYPVLTSCSKSIQTAFELMRGSFHQGGKLLICETAEVPPTATTLRGS